MLSRISSEYTQLALAYNNTRVCVCVCARACLCQCVRVCVCVCCVVKGRYASVDETPAVSGAMLTQCTLIVMTITNSTARHSNCYQLLYTYTDVMCFEDVS